MKKNVRSKRNLFNLSLNILFYIMLTILVCALIYPYTSFSYRKPIFQTFNARLNKNDVVLEVGESFHLYVVGVNKRATFSSRDFKVATVDLNGNVHAWRKGRTVITVKTKDATLKCRIKVTEKKE